MRNRDDVIGELNLFSCLLVHLGIIACSESVGERNVLIVTWVEECPEGLLKTGPSLS